MFCCFWCSALWGVLLSGVFCCLGCPAVRGRFAVGEVLQSLVFCYPGFVAAYGVLLSLVLCCLNAFCCLNCSIWGILLYWVLLLSRAFCCLCFLLSVVFWCLGLFCFIGRLTLPKMRIYKIFIVKLIIYISIKELTLVLTLFYC